MKIATLIFAWVEAIAGGFYFLYGMSQISNDSATAFGGFILGGYLLAQGVVTIIHVTRSANAKSHYMD